MNNILKQNCQECLKTHNITTVSNKSPYQQETLSHTFTLVKTASWLSAQSLIPPPSSLPPSLPEMISISLPGPREQFFSSQAFSWEYLTVLVTVADSCQNIFFSPQKVKFRFVYVPDQHPFINQENAPAEFYSRRFSGMFYKMLPSLGGSIDSPSVTIEAHGAQSLPSEDTS